MIVLIDDPIVARAAFLHGIWEGTNPVTFEIRLFAIAVAAALTIAALCRLIARLQTDARRARLENEADTEAVPSTALREGMPGYLDVITLEGSWHGRTLLRAASRQSLALTLPDTPAGILLKPGVPIELTLLGDSAAYRLRTSVTDRRIVNGIPTIYVERPDWVQRVQRRKHFRIALNQPTVLSLLANTASAPPVRALVQDLSAGGIRLFSATSLPIGALVQVRLPVPGPFGACYAARILECAEGKGDSSYPHMARGEFLHLSEETRNLLVNYCFDVQRETMRRRHSPG